jgi:hypothetical protein
MGAFEVDCHRSSRPEGKHIDIDARAEDAVAGVVLDVDARRW